MIHSTHIENPDVVLIGSGIMSTNLGAMLTRLESALSLQVCEVTDELGQISSNGRSNVGTGHEQSHRNNFDKIMNPHFPSIFWSCVINNPTVSF